MHAGENGASAAFSYAHSKGLFAGISLEASVISTRSDVNRQFYGTSIIAADLLNGKEPQPKAAEPLYQVKSIYTNNDIAMLQSLYDRSDCFFTGTN